MGSVAENAVFPPKPFVVDLSSREVDVLLSNLLGKLGVTPDGAKSIAATVLREAGAIAGDAFGAIVEKKIVEHGPQIMAEMRAELLKNVAGDPPASWFARMQQMYPSINVDQANRIWLDVFAALAEEPAKSGEAAA